MSKYKGLLDQKRVSSKELENLLEARAKDELAFLLIDVREPYEYEAAHITGVDLLLPTTEFQTWAPVLAESYGDQTLVLTCRTSNRTAQVQAILIQMGLTRVIDHAGGIVEYLGTTEQGMEGAKGV